MNRFYRLDLTQPPTVKTLGFMHLELGERKWQIPADHWHLIMPDYAGVVQIGSRPFEFREGSVLLLPPRAVVRLSFAEVSQSGHWHSLFTLVDEGETDVAIPVWTELGLEYHWWRDRFTYISNWSHLTTAHRVPHVWSLLWRLARPAEEVRVHPYVKMADSIMRDRLSSDLRIEALCDEIQVSQTHLNRLFREEYGVSPKRYLLDLRVSRAVNLLRSTTKPLKEIASAVGIPDVQQFNKTMRHFAGLSPTALRHTAESPTDYVSVTPATGTPPEKRPKYGAKETNKLADDRR